MESVHPFLFWVIACLTGLCAIATVVTHNIVRAATWLLFTLAGTSGIFFLLGADLVGTIQLLVYVGGTMVLVVFGVMLTAQSPFITMKTSSAEWAISITVGIILLTFLGFATFSIGGTFGPKDEKHPISKELAALNKAKDTLEETPATATSSMEIGQAFLGVESGPPQGGDPSQKHVKRAHYLLPFEIVSVHLLVVLIGAAYLARAKKRREASA
jgi:NADH:ubiquinone oxidoreductase subunit 6 (subunit J)